MHIFLFFIIVLYASILFGLVLGCIKKNTIGSPQRTTFVSVIIAAKNEQDALPNCLYALKNQSWPQSLFEVIVIDDRSDDKTRDVALAHQTDFTHFKLVTHTANAFKSSKKSALQQAVAQADGEILFFTDADCTPPSQWIEKMLTFFHSNTGLVAGFSPQTSDDTPFWSRMLFIDALSAAFVAAGSIGWGRGVTCAGRNLAVRRKTFDDAGGYDAFPDTLSGDDDFLLQTISKTQWQIAYAFHPDAVVPAIGPSNLAGFLRQKTRHISAGSAFSISAQIGYALYHALNLSLWCFFIFSFFTSLEFAVPFVCKLLIDFWVMSCFAHKFAHSLSVEFILWQPLFLCYHLVAAFTAFKGRRSW